MVLGDLMARLDDEMVTTETLMATGDLTLISQVHDRATLLGKTVGEHVADAVAAFSHAAAPDDWMQLMTAANNSENPGGAVLKIIISASGSDVLTKPGDGARHGPT